MHLMYPQLVSTHILMFHRTLRIDEKDIKRMKKVFTIQSAQTKLVVSC